MLNFQAFVRGDGGKSGKGPQSYITHFSLFLPHADRKSTGPEIFVCPVWLKIVNKYVKYFGFSLQGVLNPGTLSVMKRALPSRGAFQGKNISIHAVKGSAVCHVKQTLQWDFYYYCSLSRMCFSRWPILIRNFLIYFIAVFGEKARDALQRVLSIWSQGAQALWES